MGFSGGDPENPFTYEGVDYRGRRIGFHIDWNPITRAVIEASAYRDPGCLFTKILVGVGNDGTPDSTNKKFTVPVGQTVVPKNVFNSLQIDTIDDVTAYQVTAGR